MKVFNLQMTSLPDVEANLTTVRDWLNKHAQAVCHNIVVLPECFAYFGGKEHGNLGLAEAIGEGELQQSIADVAKEFGLYLVAGSIPIAGEDKSKFKNMCLVFGPDGKLVSHYQKIHLFDVEVADNTKSYRESDTAEAGNEVVLFEANGVKVGVAICYDLRFPGLFATLRQKGAELIVLPSAFTQTTGEAHWHTLVTARAIENQCYFAACNQVGVHRNGRETYGHSLIVDPWGKVLSDAKSQLGVFGAALDLAYLQHVRQQMPVANHNQFESKLK